jgi:hypothetical protein
MRERDEARIALSERTVEFMELSDSFISEQNLRMDDRNLADAGATWVRIFHPGHDADRPYYPGCGPCEFLREHDKARE